MARRVFFSFHYDNDINRSMTVRNSWVTQGKEAAGFIDKAEFEQIKRQGDTAVHNWIDKQLEGTSVTVVLIGSETLKRPFVQYDIINDNRFNQNPKKYSCNTCKTVDALTGSYIAYVEEETFLSNPTKYINNAYDKSENDAAGYDLVKQR